MSRTRTKIVCPNCSGTCTGGSCHCGTCDDQGYIFEIIRCGGTLWAKNSGYQSVEQAGVCETCGGTSYNNHDRVCRKSWFEDHHGRKISRTWGYYDPRPLR